MKQMNLNGPWPRGYRFSDMEADLIIRDWYKNRRVLVDLTRKVVAAPKPVSAPIIEPDDSPSVSGPRLINRARKWYSQ